VITSKTRAIVLNSPSNPTGAIHAAADLQQVLELCASHAIHWISDEIYEDFVYNGVHTSPADSHPDQGLRIGGLSKSHSMMGWRVGWVTGHPDVIEGLKGLHQHMVTAACGASQAALPVALRVHAAHVASMREIFHGRGRLLQDRLRQGGLECSDPIGAFYHFLPVPEAAQISGGSVALAEAILEHTDVVTIPGFGFGTGGEGYLRLAYTVSDDLLSEAASRVAVYIADVVQRG
jgi:aspartate/methionine/tyrosine aminotransferase